MRLDVGAVAKGYKARLAYVIQMEGITEVRPNITTHPAYGEAIEEALASGVEIIFLCTRVTEDSLHIVKAIKYHK